MGVSNQISPDQINQLLGIDEPFKAPDRLMEILLDKELREKTFREFLKVSTDVSFDQFHAYFEAEQAGRKKLKQDFTPQSIAILLDKLVGHRGHTYHENAAGTGGIVITKWYADMMSESPFTYMPHEYFYYCEELSDRATPFLIFNLALRGMNAIVFHGDAIERTCRGVFFIQNAKDNYMGFSDVNVMPYSDDVKEEFSITEWVGEPYPAHVETDYADWEASVIESLAYKHNFYEVVRRMNESGSNRKT
jgi:hypothetical protein